MKFILTFLLSAIASFAHAELKTLEVISARKESPFLSNQKGFTLMLIDAGGKSDMISCLLSVPNAFGEIEASVLSLFNSSKKQIGRIVLGAQTLDADSKSYEFDLEESLLKNSILQVSHRDGDDLYVAKIIIGSFEIKRTPNTSPF